MTKSRYHELPTDAPYTVQDLLTILEILRDPQQGCPWDKIQTHSSIRMNFLEEAYEVADAIDLDDPALLCEELGDVLMQVAFHTCIEQERGRFDWQQVCDGVCRKLIYRHPHIFGDAESINDWDTIKNKEKGRVTLEDDLQSVPLALPALLRAAKLQKRAARGGVVTDSGEQPLQDALHTVAVAEAQGEGSDAERAIGELLFQTVALARRLGVNPEEALQRRNTAFQQSAATMSQKDGQ